MKQSTVCYLFSGEDCLLLHRNKKKEDENQGKWIGVGGKFLENESPEDCLLREFKEETGLDLEEYAYRGLVTFVSDQWEGEYMHLFTATAFSGTLQTCEEGTFAWKPFSQLFTLPRWAGDDIFLRLLEQRRDFFSLKLVYTGENLVEAVLDGVNLPV